MVEITFSLDGEDHSVRVDPDSGHPREVYGSGDRVAEAVAAEGYEFVGGPPGYQELARAHRSGGPPDTIDLGAIDDRVREADDGSGGAGPVGGSGSGSESDLLATGSGFGSDPEEVTVELVGPDGRGVERTFEPSQTVAQVRADVNSYHGIDRTDRVLLYRSPAKEAELDRSTSVEEFDGDTVYWDVESL